VKLESTKTISNTKKRSAKINPLAKPVNKSPQTAQFNSANAQHVRQDVSKIKKPTKLKNANLNHTAARASLPRKIPLPRSGIAPHAQQTRTNNCRGINYWPALHRPTAPQEN